MNRAAAVLLLATASAAAQPARAPRVVLGHITKTELYDHTIWLGHVDVGKDDGVDHHATCVFLDDADKQSIDECVLIRVDHHTAIVRTHESRRIPPSFTRVRFEVPP